MAVSPEFKEQTKLDFCPLSMIFLFFLSFFSFFIFPQATVLPCWDVQRTQTYYSFWSFLTFLFICTIIIFYITGIAVEQLILLDIHFVTQLESSLPYL